MEGSKLDGSCKIIKSRSKPWPSFIPYASMESLGSPLLDSSTNKSCNDLTCLESTAEYRRKNQIFQTNNSSFHSSWKKVTFLWRGWLQKRSSGIVGQWQSRWFELRQEPATVGGVSVNRVVLQYIGRGSHGGEEAKRLELIDARRDCGHDVEGRVCLSVGAVGRSGRVLLGSASGCEAESLLSCISLVLLPPTADSGRIVK